MKIKFKFYLIWYYIFFIVACNNNNDIKQERFEVHKLMLNGCYKEALLKANDLINKFPKNDDFYSLRGRIYYKLNEFEKSRGDFEHAIT